MKFKLLYSPQRADQHGYRIVADGEVSFRTSIDPIREVDFQCSELTIEYAPLDQRGRKLCDPVAVGIEAIGAPVVTAPVVAAPVVGAPKPEPAKTTYRKPPPPAKPEAAPIVTPRELTDTKFRWADRIKRLQGWAFYRSTQ